MGVLASCSGILPNCLVFSLVRLSGSVVVMGRLAGEDSHTSKKDIRIFFLAWLTCPESFSFTSPTVKEKV